MEFSGGTRGPWSLQVIDSQKCISETTARLLTGTAHSWKGCCLQSASLHLPCLPGSVRRECLSLVNNNSPQPSLAQVLDFASWEAKERVP